MMRKGHVRILLAGCAAVLAATLGATTALAATTWTIKPGGSTSAKSGNAIFIDTATGTKITCQSMTTTGTFKSGSGLSGSDAGSITGVGFNHCTGPLGVTISYRATDLPWHINVTSYKSGVVTGTISHMQIKMTGPSCAGVIDGTSATASDGVLKFSYTDSTGGLKLLTSGGNLRYYDVRGCAGLFDTGNPATLGATLVLSPKQVITSP